MHKLAKYAFLAAIALTWIRVQASAQLTLDNFTSGAYVKHLNTGPQQDQHYAKLAPGSPLGAARQQIFPSDRIITSKEQHRVSAKAFGSWMLVSAPSPPPILRTELLSRAPQLHWAWTSADIQVSN
jgi:hypothetical protein